MHCPSHVNTELISQRLEPGVDVSTCPKCLGHWMPMAAYWRWREQLTSPLPNLEARNGGRDVDAIDSEGGKRCPADGAFLIRHQVGHGLAFRIDRCGKCGGAWLDAGEWEALRRRHIHDDLHLIFTSSWQAEVRRQRKERTDEERLLEQLGEPENPRSKEVRAWLESKGKRSSGDALAELLGFLLDGLGDIIP